jgi:hypothetical protein
VFVKNYCADVAAGCLCIVPGVDVGGTCGLSFLSVLWLAQCCPIMTLELNFASAHVLNDSLISFSKF